MEDRHPLPESQDSKSEPVDEAEFRKSFRKLKQKMKTVWNDLLRRRNRNALWKF